MELPDDILKIIKEYSMPISRPDWKKGNYCNRHIFYKIDGLNYRGTFSDAIHFEYCIQRKNLSLSRLPSELTFLLLQLYIFR